MAAPTSSPPSSCPSGTKLSDLDAIRQSLKSLEDCCDHLSDSETHQESDRLRKGDNIKERRGGGKRSRRESSAHSSGPAGKRQRVTQALTWPWGKKAPTEPSPERNPEPPPAPAPAPDPTPTPAAPSPAPKRKRSPSAVSNEQPRKRGRPRRSRRQNAARRSLCPFALRRVPPTASLSLPRRAHPLFPSPAPDHPRAEGPARTPSRHRRHRHHHHHHRAPTRSRGRLAALGDREPERRRSRLDVFLEVDSLQRHRHNHNHGRRTSSRGTRSERRRVTHRKTQPAAHVDEEEEADKKAKNIKEPSPEETHKSTARRFVKGSQKSSRRSGGPRYCPRCMSAEHRRRCRRNRNCCGPEVVRAAPSIPAGRLRGYVIPRGRATPRGRASPRARATARAASYSDESLARSEDSWRDVTSESPCESPQREDFGRAERKRQRRDDEVYFLHPVQRRPAPFAGDTDVYFWDRAPIARLSVPKGEAQGRGGAPKSGESDWEADSEEERFVLEYTYLIPLTPQMLLVALQSEKARAGDPSFNDVLRFVSDNFGDILYPSVLEDEVRTKLDVLVALGVVRMSRGAYELQEPYTLYSRLEDDVIARFWQMHAFRRTRLVSQFTQTEGTRGLRKRVRPEANLLDGRSKVPRKEGEGDGTCECTGSCDCTGSCQCGEKKWRAYIG